MKRERRSSIGACAPVQFTYWVFYYKKKKKNIFLYTPGKLQCPSGKRSWQFPDNGRKKGINFHSNKQTIFFFFNKFLSFYLIYMSGHFINLLVFLAPGSVPERHSSYSWEQIKGQLPFLYIYFSLQIIFIWTTSLLILLLKKNKDFSQQGLWIFDAIKSRPFARSHMIEFLMVSG